MPRTSEPTIPTPTKLKYRLKKGFGKHSHRGVSYKGGDIIEVWTPLELGASLDKWTPLDDEAKTALLSDPLEREQQAKLPNPLKPVHRGGGRWFVQNMVTLEYLNDQPLSKADAFALAGAKESEPK